jgi:hypothetical protein
LWYSAMEERLYTRERAKALARKITCELLTPLPLDLSFLRLAGIGASVTWSSQHPSRVSRIHPTPDTEFSDIFEAPFSVVT